MAWPNWPRRAVGASDLVPRCERVGVIRPSTHLERGCARIFTDQGESGTKASRPQWDRCLDHFGAGSTLVITEPRPPRCAGPWDSAPVTAPAEPATQAAERDRSNPQSSLEAKLQAIALDLQRYRLAPWMQVCS